MKAGLAHIPFVVSSGKSGAQLKVTLCWSAQMVHPHDPANVEMSQEVIAMPSDSIDPEYLAQISSPFTVKHPFKSSMVSPGNSPPEAKPIASPIPTCTTILNNPSETATYWRVRRSTGMQRGTRSKLGWLTRRSLYFETVSHFASGFCRGTDREKDNNVGDVCARTRNNVSPPDRVFECCFDFTASKTFGNQ